MATYFTDLKEINRRVAENTLDKSQVRIITAPDNFDNTSIDLLTDFPNLTEITFPVTCQLHLFPLLVEKLLKAKNLLKISFVVFNGIENAPEIDDQEADPEYFTSALIIRIPLITDKEKLPADVDPETYQPNKRLKPNPNPRTVLRPVIKLDMLQLIKVEFPKLIDKLGKRLNYLDLRFDIFEFNNTLIANRVAMHFNKGKFYFDTNHPNLNGSYIFESLIKNSLLGGLETDGTHVYNLNELKITIPSLKIIARKNILDSISKDYLSQLITKTPNVIVEYNPETFTNIEFYSNLLMEATEGNLINIEAIVPLSDLDDHLRLNQKLEQIHVHLGKASEVAKINRILSRYRKRSIDYHIHYQYRESLYWLGIKALEENNVFHHDLTRTLNSLL